MGRGRKSAAPDEQLWFGICRVGAWPNFHPRVQFSRDPEALNQLDFVRDTLADGRVFRTLNIVDDYTRECLALEVDTSLPGARVVRVLERL